MIKNQTARVWVNRIVAFLIGGFAIWVVMSVTVVSSLRSQTETLQTALNEPAALLADAEQLFGSAQYSRASARLDTLLDRYPGSREAADGRNLMVAIETSVQQRQDRENELDMAWEAAAGDVRDIWEATTAARLRSDLQERREKLLMEGEQLERDLVEILDREWESAKEQVRADWEQQG